jgi:hypothetical protein
VAPVAQAAQPKGTPQLGEVHPARRPLLSANAAAAGRGRHVGLPRTTSEDCNQFGCRSRTSGKGHGRPIRLRNWHVRCYVNCGCAKTKGRHSGFGPTTDKCTAKTSSRPLPRPGERDVAFYRSCLRDGAEIPVIATRSRRTIGGFSSLCILRRCER